jgi:hypothetical protein
MNQQATESSVSPVSIVDLPGIVTDLFARAGRPLLPNSDKGPGLFVRYLRRKPARGLAVIYAVDEIGRHGEHAHDPNSSVSLTLDEPALEGAHIRFNANQARQAALEIEASGVLRAEELALSVQAFPADDGLPALAVSLDAGHGAVFEMLQHAARTQLGSEAWRLVSAVAVPVRYKPASRCVVRYHLILARGEQEGQETRSLTIFGKVYADPAQARSVQALQQRLYDEQRAKVGSSALGQVYSAPLLPRPLGIIEEIGLTFNEAVQPADPQERMLTGTRAIRPHIARGRGGAITAISIPEEELRLTAVALARLHTSAIHPEGAPRTGAKEAKRARERAALIARHTPAQAEEVQQLAQSLASRLEALQPDTYRPAHGGFKSSQILFHSHQVFVVDFDGFCLADAALDVGYFLAYLRPSGLWYGSGGMREWFDAAAEVFTSTYRQAMRDFGVEQEAIDGILTRSRLYEAALIFKIATRRANRLNSPRSKELSAMLREIAACLSDEVRR